MASQTDRPHAPRSSRIPSSFILHPSSFSSRRAFTLTELLIVITIIAILAGLGSYAAVQALGTAKQTRIKVELDGIDAAFKAYKEKYGSYPPCNLANTAAVRSHIARAFPRYVIGNLVNDLPAAGVDVTNFRPDQALVFWLQGFGPDPVNPFLTVSGQQLNNGSPQNDASGNPLRPGRSPFFSFDPTRLWQVASTAGATAIISPTSTPVASYFPQGLVPPSSSAAPYLYWEPGTITVNVAGGTTTTSSNYGKVAVTGTTAVVTPTVSFNNPAAPYSLQIFTNAGLPVPYWLDVANAGTTDPTENWANMDSFQIISTGMDGQYGNLAGTAARLYPTGTGYDTPPNQADDDNITNFCAKARLGDAKP